MQIDLRQAGRQYNRNWIFRHLDASWAAGSRVALLGPNGSGKSTLLQIVAGWVSLNEGSLQLSNEGRGVELEHIHLHTAICAPYLELPEELSLSELVDFQTRLKGSFKQLTKAEALDLSGFKHQTGRQLKTYSSGMKQRAKLLLAFMSPASLLLLDEPLSNLDSDGHLFYNLLVERFAKGRTLIVASNMEAEYGFCTEKVQLSAYK